MSGATDPVGNSAPSRRDTGIGHSSGHAINKETPSGRNKDDTSEREQRAPWVALACYLVAVVSVSVSLNTSWRFAQSFISSITLSVIRLIVSLETDAP